MSMRMSVPAERIEIVSSPRVVDALLRWCRLFLIELRRSPALPAAAVIALLTWWLMRGGLRIGVVRWSEISAAAGDPMIPVSATAAGMAAFVAAREHRRRTVDQVAVTSFGRVSRDLVVVLPVLVWCLAGYVTVVAGYFAYAAWKATWGGPEWRYVWIALASIVTCVAFGWLTGSVLRHRLTPLLVIGVTFAAQVAHVVTERFRMVRVTDPNGMTHFQIREAWWKNLVPWELKSYVELEEVVALGLLWMIALAALFWCLAWWWNHRSATAIASGVLALMVSGVAATGLVTQEPNTPWRVGIPAYVQPVCETRLDGAIEVCVHPQDEALLDESADAIARLVAPIAGIPGVPTRFEESQPRPPADSTGSVPFSIYDATSIPDTLYATLLRELIQSPSGPMGYDMRASQYVVGAWLLQEAGISQEEAITSYLLMPVPHVQAVETAVADGQAADAMLRAQDRAAGSSDAATDAFEREVQAAVDRFAALPDEERRAWLEANWDVLRAGGLSLEDLP